jgi:hypothetical protein
MSNITPFQFASTPLRVVVDGAGEPWFVAADVCAALGVLNPSEALSRMDPDEKGTHTVATSGGDQQMLAVNESGLYSMILFSRKADRRIKRAILSQVSNSRAVLDALRDFEVPDDLPDMYVYAIREVETGRIKLGISRDPEARLAQLQVGNSQRLELVAVRSAANRFTDERRLHADYAHTHVRGEWFTAEAQGALQ